MKQIDQAADAAPLDPKVARMVRAQLPGLFGPVSFDPAPVGPAAEAALDRVRGKAVPRHGRSWVRKGQRGRRVRAHAHD